MNLKLIGAVLILISCGSVGFRIAANFKKEVRMLEELESALAALECDLQYRQTPLPELCKIAAQSVHGVIAKLFLCIAEEIDKQVSPDVKYCVNNALYCFPDLPDTVRDILTRFGESLGKFDMDGQMLGISAAKDACRSSVQRLLQDSQPRLRSYKTLGICAGAAIIILFI